MVCLGQGVYRLSGVRRMHERPQAALFQALRDLGYRIDSPNDQLPALIHGGGPRPGRCRVSIEESSQFASALLLCAQTGGWQVEIAGENAGGIALCADEFGAGQSLSPSRREIPDRGGRFQRQLFLGSRLAVKEIT